MNFTQIFYEYILFIILYNSQLIYNIFKISKHYLNYNNYII